MKNSSKLVMLGLLATAFLFAAAVSFAELKPGLTVVMVDLKPVEGAFCCPKARGEMQLTLFNDPSQPAHFTTTQRFGFEVQGLESRSRRSFNLQQLQEHPRRFWSLYLTAPSTGTLRLCSFDTTQNSLFSTKLIVPFGVFEDILEQPVTIEIVAETDDGNDSCDFFTGCPPEVVVLRGSTN
jgi:hypothetical protein